MARKFLSDSLARIILFCAAAAACPSCVKLPRRAAAVTPAQAIRAGARVEGRVPISLNRASREELEALPGIGPSLAARIVEQRECYGPFRRAEHLMLVRGISERRFTRLRPFVNTD